VPKKKDPFWVDPKIVSSKWQHGDNKVTYAVFRDDTPVRWNSIRRPVDVTKEKNANKTDGWCFSSLLSMTKGKDVNRVWYHMKEAPKPNTCPALTLPEKKAWLRVAKAAGFLPKHVTLATAVDGKVVMDLTGVTPAQIYMYLSAFRFFREDSGMAKAATYLVTKKGMNPYAAMVVATKVCTEYKLHHFLTCVREYAKVDDPNKMTFPLHQMIGLQRFCRHPHTHDTREVGKYSGDFSCNTRIAGISKVKRELPISALFNEHIIAAIMSKDDKDAKAALEAFDKGE
jgi:hypothetical protein